MGKGLEVKKNTEIGWKFTEKFEDIHVADDVLLLSSTRTPQRQLRSDRSDLMPPKEWSKDYIA